MYECNKDTSAKKYGEIKVEINPDAPENVPSSADLAAEIDANNTELTEKTANAMTLTNSISGLTSNAPNATTSSTPSNFARLLSLTSDGAAGPTTALGTTSLTAPTTAAPQGQDRSLLALLSAPYNLLTPNDLALPLNDPSIFLPTPFAPGENANTLLRQQRNNRGASRFNVSAQPPPAPNMAANPRQDLLHQLAALHPPTATTPALNPQQGLVHQLAALQPSPAPILPAHLPQGVLHPLAAAHHSPGQIPEANNLLREIAAAYGFGGQRTAFGNGGRPLPQSLLQLHPENSRLNYPGIGTNSAGRNYCGTTAGLSARHNHPNAMLAGFYHPGVSGAPAAYNLNNPGPSGVSFTNTGSSSQHSTSTDSSILLSTPKQPCVSAGVPLSKQPSSFTNTRSTPQQSVITNSLPNQACISSMASLSKQTPLTTSTGSLPQHSTDTNSSTHSLSSTQVRASNKAFMSKQPLLTQGQLIRANAESFNIENAQSASALQKSDNSEIRASPPSPEANDGDISMKTREARWIVRYNELLEFRVENGHCRVPHGYSQNRKLSWWVMNQRAQFAHRKQGKKTWLTDERIQLLNDVGFIWTPHMKKSSAGKNKKTTTSSENDKCKSKDEKKNIVKMVSSKRKRSDFSGKRA